MFKLYDFKKFTSQFIQDESGQGIVEYGAALAFAAVLVAVMASQTTTVKSAVSQAFSSVTSSLGTMTGQIS